MEIREQVARLVWKNEHFKNHHTWEDSVKHKQGVVEKSYGIADLIIPLVRADMQREIREWVEENGTDLYRAYPNERVISIPYDAWLKSGIFKEGE